jgi:hypothetical protein
MGGKSVAEKKVVRVLLGIPTKGNTDPEAYDNRLEMAIHLGNLQTLSHLGQKEYCGTKYDIPDGVEYQFSLSTIGDVFVAYAREQMARTVVNNEFDYLFMIDDDMIAPPDLFEKLIKHDVDIIAPLAFMRFFPHKPVIYNIAEGYDNIRKQHYYQNYVVERYPKKQLVECDAVGFGAVLINAKCFKKMKQPWMMVMSGAGEDIHFCHCARKAGFKVYMDTSVQLAHLGARKKITEVTYERAVDNGKEREEKGDLDKYGEFGKVIFEDRPGIEVNNEN